MDHRQRPGDARLKLDRGELIRARVYISPLWSVVSSVFEVVLGWRRGVPEEWVQFVRQRTAGLDLSAFHAFDGHHRTVPNFLMPIPPKAEPSIAEELEAFRRTPPRRVRGDLRAEFGFRLPAPYRPFQQDPAAALAKVSSSLQTYWEAVFEPTWPRMRAIIEREVLVCSRLLATEGVLAALARIHPAFELRNGALSFEAALPGHAITPVGDRVVTLIPLIAGSQVNITSIDRPDAVLLAYAAPGTSAAWHTAAPSGDSALTRLVGETRARLIDSLAEPATTTMLAKQLGLAAATVSHHLSALADQGVVDANRMGNAVYYGLTERGRSLAELFSA